jgi:MoaA/NifB/PqqE/SkfB family radical SAM enzyme
LKKLSFVDRRHFMHLPSDDDAKELFKSSIKMVEIEVFSYCNRKCWFCPNSKLDRNSKNIFMDEGLYVKILNDLARINYCNTISFSRYNEPLADKIILKRLQQAREILPQVKLHTNSNGDFVTADYIEELYQHGLRSLRVQVYLAKDEPFQDDKVVLKIKKKADQIGLPYEMILSKPGLRHEAQIFYKDMDIHIYSRNFEQNGCSRGELVDVRRDYQRTAPCLIPFQSLYIDYTGKVMPCCNLRSDAPEHQNYIVGDMNYENIFQIFANGPLVGWRRELFNFGPKKRPCNTCTYSIQKRNRSYILTKIRLLFSRVGKQN